MKPHYTEEESNAILRRAIEKMPLKSDTSREQLESVAAELGVTPELLRKAEEEWKAEELERTERAAFITAHRTGFRRTLMLAVAVSVLFFLWSLVRGGNNAISMAVVLMAGSTIGLALRAAFVLRTGGEDFELQFTRWRIERRARELAARELGRIAPR